MKHIYDIELIIEQIDGYNGGYPDIHLNMKVVAKNIDLAKKELNWEPKVKFEEGLVKTIEYFKEKC